MERLKLHASIDGEVGSPFQKKKGERILTNMHNNKIECNKE
jgi:hypothetical protein